MKLDVRFVHGPRPIGQSSLEAYRRTPVSVDGVAIPPTVAEVVAVYPDATADIKLAGGAILPHAMIASTAEFIVTKTPGQPGAETYGTKKLPPKGSRVIVDFLDGSISSPVIRGSVFARVNTGDNENLLDPSESAKDVTIMPSQMKETRDPVSGDYKLEDLDAPDFHILLDRTNQVIEIADWAGNVFRMESGKVTINDNFQVDQ